MHSLHPLHLLGFPLIFAALSLTMAEQDSEEVGYQDNEWYEDLDQDQYQYKDEEKMADGGEQSREKRVDENLGRSEAVSWERITKSLSWNG